MRGLLVIVIGACACGPKVNPGADDPGACSEGETRCSAQGFSRCENGEWAVAEQCAQACDETLGCVACKPNESLCEGETSQVCRIDGSGWDETVCDTSPGLTCYQGLGCVDACSAALLGTSYIGCEYFPTVTANSLSPLDVFSFAIAISNTSSATASVTIEGGALAQPTSFEVAPGSVTVRELPWHDRLIHAIGNSQYVVGGSYRVVSNRPITVYQFNPLQYEAEGVFSHTNDASLLYPTNALTGSYWVASWPSWTFVEGIYNPSLLAITATGDATQVTIVPTANVKAGDLGLLSAGIPMTLTMNSRDVLQLFAVAGDDLTGTRVTADKPIQVIGGHYCTNLPHEIGACDHLEEVMMPVEAASTRYAVTPPGLKSSPDPKIRMLRIIATQPGTTLSYDPPQPGVPTALGAPGSFFTIESNAQSFVIEASEKIVVAEYMVGRGASPEDEGDPSLSIAVPIDQYRTHYLFHAPLSYDVNFVNVVAPTGATVLLDGTPVSGFSTIGASGYAVARVLLSDTSDGNHSIEGSERFGISVYGYGFATSYWYPGGLDLEPIVIE